MILLSAYRSLRKEERWSDRERGKRREKEGREGSPGNLVKTKGNECKKQNYSLV